MSLGTPLITEWKEELPWQFKDQPNLDAVISAIGEQLTALEDVNAALIADTDVDTAAGTNLDMVGKIVGITRVDACVLLGVSLSSMDDETYRKVLQFQILKNNADGTYEDIMKGLYLLWGDDASISYAENPVPVNQTYNSEEWTDPGPASVHITFEDVPTDSVDPVLLEDMVIRPAGVKLYFTVTYRDAMGSAGDGTADDIGFWDRFTNLTITHAIYSDYSGEIDYSGDDEATYGSATSEYLGLEYYTYNGTVQYKGTVQYGVMQGAEEADTVDAVILNQAKLKLLRHRMYESLSGESLKIVYFVFGTGTDDSGGAYTATGAETELKNEVYRTEYYYREWADDSTVTYCGVIPSDECAGEYISEIGLADEDGDLICIKTFAPKEKPDGAEMIFKIDDTVTLADEDEEE